MLFKVDRSENQFFAIYEEAIRDIENLIAYKRFKIKFCIFYIRKKSKIGSAVSEISLIKLGKSHKNEVFYKKLKKPIYLFWTNFLFKI